MSDDRLCHDIENKTGVLPAQPDVPRCRPRSPGGEDRRHQAVARYLAGDRIEEICRELGCSKSWLYKWRDRYQADDPTWAQLNEVLISATAVSRQNLSTGERLRESATVAVQPLNLEAALAS